MRRRLPGFLPCLLLSAALGLLFPGPADLEAQQPCPPTAGESVAAGWRAYRADSIAVAERHFGAADAQCPANFDAKVGLGYTALRLEHPSRADSLFRIVTLADSDNADGWSGLALAAERLRDTTTALRAARHAVRLNPNDPGPRQVLDRLAPGWDRPSATTPVRAARLSLAARTRGSRFEIPGARGWVPFYIKGVNIGAALPGKFPSEFPPDSATYAGWLRQIAGMNANTVRLYTILPPPFYRALRAWNLGHPTRQLWLVHGVWTELPPRDDFDAPAWKGEFRDEMHRVVDLLHGSATIPIRPGHAGGRYDADVSRWTLAYIIGREWEPYSVVAYDAAHPGLGAYHGAWLNAEHAPAMDRWMAEQCDYLLDYEVRRYNTLRPIAYTNWPTLDPLTHPTEATTDEEIAWRLKLHRPAIMTKEYDNDAIGLDANLIRPTAANSAGWFASYHAYPYYPDFMLYDRDYNRARSSLGRSNYFGYLADLKRHHRGIPLVIAEYGVPSSRGKAHSQPQGWDHGGHDEAAMARIDGRLTREIRESGAAGGILFAWIDEWFKKNWVVVDLEIPLENTRQWHNMMDAEQNYGVLGMYPGSADQTPALGGDPARWTTGALLSRAADPLGTSPGTLTARSDEAYLYLAVSFPGLRGRSFPWDSTDVELALDTYLARVGQHRIPGLPGELEPGFEFLVRLGGPRDAEIRVLPEYNPYGAAPDSSGDDLGHFYHRPVTILDRDDGVFDSMYVTITRARYARDGAFFPAGGYNRGRLRYGNATASTLSDWYYDSAAGLLELRIPWMLLNVTDPSTRTLLYETAPGDGFGTVPAEDWHIGVVVTGPNGNARSALPGLDTGWKLDAFTPWRWAPWETPRYHERLKPAYDTMRRVWGAMP